MTATETLRQLLDERSVEWWEEDGHTLWYGQSIHHAASAFSSFMFGENDKVHLNAMVSPEQAVEATLGRGTCGNVSDFPKYEFVCSECGGRLDIVDEFDNQTVQHADGSFGPRFCPSCGRKVEQ